MRHWNTTLAGFVCGFVHLWAGGLDSANAATAAGLARLGICAKDVNVSGTGS